MHNKYLKILTIAIFCVGLTKCQPDSVKDIDGNVYETVTIGKQVWMTENLKTTRYNNGDVIGTTIPATLVIEGENAPEYQWAYDGDENNVGSHGRLYTWYVAADKRNVCPVGWHVPSDPEWRVLTGYLIKNGYSYGTGYKGMDIAKSMAATSGWDPDETAGSTGNDQESNNKSGFKALPSGARMEDGNFYVMGHNGNWWTTTEGGPTFMQGLTGIIVNESGGIFHDIYYDYCYVNSYSNNKKYGMSIRCIKDKD